MVLPSFSSVRVKETKYTYKIPTTQVKGFTKQIKSYGETPVVKRLTKKQTKAKLLDQLRQSRGVYRAVGKGEQKKAWVKGTKTNIRRLEAILKVKRKTKF